MARCPSRAQEGHGGNFSPRFGLFSLPLGWVGGADSAAHCHTGGSCVGSDTRTDLNDGDCVLRRRALLTRQGY